MTTKHSTDPSALTDADLPTMTRAERAAYYEANADRLDELFDDTTQATFLPEPKGVDLVVSVRIKSDEAETLTAAARAAGKPLSTWLREVGLAAATGRAASPRKVGVRDLTPAAVASVKAELAERLLVDLAWPTRSVVDPQFRTERVTRARKYVSRTIKSKHVGKTDRGAGRKNVPPAG